MKGKYEFGAATEQGSKESWYEKTWRRNKIRPLK
jgi:hypothetical protein